MMGYHASHPRYTKQIKDKLNQLNSTNSNMTPSEAKAAVEMLVDQIRTKINDTIASSTVDKRINLIENLFDE